MFALMQKQCRLFNLIGVFESVNNLCYLLCKFETEKIGGATAELNVEHIKHNTHAWRDCSSV